MVQDIIIKNGKKEVVIASPKSNKITLNGKKIGNYFKTFNGKKYFYNGFDTNKSDLEKVGKFRKKYGFNYKIVKIPDGYINYSSQ